MLRYVIAEYYTEADKNTVTEISLGRKGEQNNEIYSS
jgi:hypothetical protein